MIIFNDSNVKISVDEISNNEFDLTITHFSNLRKRPDITVNVFNDFNMTAKRMAEFGAKIIKAVYLNLSEEDKEEILHSMEQE